MINKSQKSKPGTALAVGLTGGIASGKTLALREFSRLGAQTISLDEIARRQARRGHPVYRRIVRIFGHAILDRSGEINRKKLASLVFASPARRRSLERATHPPILREMRKRLRSAQGVAVVDVPLLFEARLEREFDVTFLVAAARKAQLERLMKRDGLSRGQARARIASQWPLPAKAAKADVVVANEGKTADFTSKIRQYHRAFELMSAGRQWKTRRR